MQRRRGEHKKQQKRQQQSNDDINNATTTTTKKRNRYYQQKVDWCVRLSHHGRHGCRLHQPRTSKQRRGCVEALQSGRISGKSDFSQDCLLIGLKYKSRAPVLAQRYRYSISRRAPCYAKISGTLNRISY